MAQFVIKDGVLHRYYIKSISKENCVDVLKVPISCQDSQYILVIQDYFTKWPVAIPMKDQMANTIVQALVSTFSNYGIPSVLHSDQGTNFENTVLKQTCEALVIHKFRTTPYHPQGDG